MQYIVLCIFNNPRKQNCRNEKKLSFRLSNRSKVEVAHGEIPHGQTPFLGDVSTAVDMTT